MKVKQSNNILNYSLWNKDTDYTNQKFNRITPIKKLNKFRSHKQYYLCKCDCGEEKEISIYNVVVGKTMSCGCYNREMASKSPRVNKLPDGVAAMKQLIWAYKRGAIKRNLDYSINEEEFYNITQQNCHYCNIVPSLYTSSDKSKNRQYLYNGIDRKDNNLGYVISNCLPCCKTCNRAKHTLGYNEFINWIKRLKSQTNF